jgi:dTDP-4-dehydrorhamnose 3,5-epimerase
VEIRELGISGAFELTPTLHGDARGTFLEWYRCDELTQVTGATFTLAQANCSVSAAGVLRGIHFADVPPGQAKYVTCSYGAVLDVVVDVRVGSPTYGAWEAVLLDDERRRAAFLTEGLGHAFMSLRENSVVQYLCSTTYAPGREHGVHPLDPDVGIEWPTQDLEGRALAPVLSAKDEQAPSLSLAQEQGLLPRFHAERTD